MCAEVAVGDLFVQLRQVAQRQLALRRRAAATDREVDRRVAHAERVGGGLDCGDAEVVGDRERRLVVGVLHHLREQGLQAVVVAGHAARQWLVDRLRQARRAVRDGLHRVGVVDGLHRARGLELRVRTHLCERRAVHFLEEEAVVAERCCWGLEELRAGSALERVRVVEHHEVVARAEQRCPALDIDQAADVLLQQLGHRRRRLVDVVPVGDAVVADQDHVVAVRADPLDVVDAVVVRGHVGLDGRERRAVEITPRALVRAGVGDERDRVARLTADGVALEVDQAPVVLLHRGVDLRGCEVVAPLPRLLLCARVADHHRCEASGAVAVERLEVDDARVVLRQCCVELGWRHVVGPPPRLLVRVTVLHRRHREVPRRGRLDLEVGHAPAAVGELADLCRRLVGVPDRADRRVAVAIVLRKE